MKFFIKYFFLSYLLLEIPNCYAQNFTIRQAPKYKIQLFSTDTLSSVEIKKLKLKSMRVYVDSVLDMETHYDQSGNKVYQKCFNGHICHLDSFFYSDKKELRKSYNEKNKLENWHVKYFRKSFELTEYYNNANDSTIFQQVYKRELHLKKGKVIYRKSIDYNKVHSIENIRYDKHGNFIESKEIHYDYLKDSLVNTTIIISEKNKPTVMTHTNGKYKHYRLDTLTPQEFSYSDYYENYIQILDDNKEIGHLYFDNGGNLKQSSNFFRIGEFQTKYIDRTYDLENKTYSEKIDYCDYNKNGLIKKSQLYKTTYEYEYY